jgi:Fic family protein
VAARVADIHTALNLGKSSISLPGHDMRAATMATRATSVDAIERSDKTNLRQHDGFSTGHLDLTFLLFVHRSATDEFQHNPHSGELRRVGVWIGAPGSSPESASFVPPAPAEVPDLVDKLLTKWRNEYVHIRTEDEGTKVKSIVAFHYEFLRIHPYLDGNGRVARTILEQQAKELLGIGHRIILADSNAYFEALQEAHAGNLQPLTKILRQAMLGEW